MNQALRQGSVPAILKTKQGGKAMRIINIENLLNQAMEQYEKDLKAFKDQPFINCRFTFYFTLHYTIENYLTDLMKTENYEAYMEHRFKDGYLKYWRGRAVFQYRNKQVILTGDLHDVMEKLGLNKLAKKIEKEIRERAGTDGYDENHIDKPNDMGYNNTYQNP